MIDRYIYLLLAVPFLLASLVIFIVRKDLRMFILKVGLVGGLMGLLIEFWYFADYWRPLSLFGQAVLSLEDFLAGVGITIVASTLYLVVTHTSKPPTSLRQRKQFAGLFMVGLGVMVLATTFLHLNSLIVSTSIVFLIALYLIMRRPSLWKRSVASGLMMALLGGVTYFILFGVLSPTYLENYFLLTGEWYNPTLFGFYPLLELWWYLSWGIFAGALVGYLTDDAVQGKSSKLQA